MFVDRSPANSIGTKKSRQVRWRLFRNLLRLMV